MHAHILGLYTAIYHVEDLIAARDWYAAMLGVQPYFDQPFYVGFNLAGHELGLLPATSTPRQSKGVVAYWGGARHRRSGSHTGGTGACLV